MCINSRLRRITCNLHLSRSVCIPFLKVGTLSVEMVVARSSLGTRVKPSSGRGGAKDKMLMIYVVAPKHSVHPRHDKCILRNLSTMYDSGRFVGLLSWLPWLCVDHFVISLGILPSSLFFITVTTGTTKFCREIIKSCHGLTY